jgi:hypothetical protein
MSSDLVIIIAGNDAFLNASSNHSKIEAGPVSTLAHGERIGDPAILEWRLNRRVGAPARSINDAKTLSSSA